MNFGEAAWRTELQLTGPLHQRALSAEEVLDDLTSELKVEDEVKITQENESPALMADGNALDLATTLNYNSG